MTIHNRIHQYRQQGRSWYQRKLSTITTLTVHHDAIPHDNRKTANSILDSIKNIHVGKGWPGASYHYFIHTDGSIYQLNNHTDITWHDSVNNNSIGIVVTGYFHTPHNNKPTDKQLASTQWLLDHLQKTLGTKKVVGHRDVGSTACPGDLFYPWVKSYKQGAGNPPTMPETLPENLLKYGRKTPEELEKFIDHELELLAGDRRKINRLETEIDGLNSQISELKQTNTSFLERIAGKLRVVVDTSEIMKAVERLLSAEDQVVKLESLLTEEKEKRESDRKGFQNDIEILRDAIDKQQKENDLLMQRVDELEKRLEVKEEAQEFTNRFSRLIEQVLLIFKKG